MKHKLIASVFALAFMAAPAFADCAPDFSVLLGKLNDAKLDEAATAKSKDLIEKINAAITAKDETACVSLLADLTKLAPAAQ